MRDSFCELSKETKCYIMAAIMVFEGYKGIDEFTEISGQLSLDVLGLSREELEQFPMPTYPQILAHLMPISDPEIRDWVITNTYSPVLKSRRKDALNDFKRFCLDLNWDVKQIKETMELVEEIENLKPIDNGASSSGCFSVLALALVCTALLAFAII